MMKRTLILILAALLTACNTAESPAVSVTETSATVSTSAETESTTVETSEETASAETVAESTADKDAADPEMLERSLYRIGNTERINKAIQKAQSGEEVTVAFIGGSITEGVGAAPGGNTKNADCYAKLAYESFASAYGTGDNVKYVNAGESGTPSTLGMLRVERDVLRHEPDVVFVEFAVNDGGDLLAQQSYESLVKTLLTYKSEPAVILILNRLNNGYSASTHMKNIGEHYDLPVVSVADAITPELDSGKMEWSDFSADYAHPNKYGHKLVSSFITYMFEQAHNTPADPYSLPEDELYGAPYKNAVLIIPTENEKDTLKLTDKGSFKSSAKGSPNFATSWEYDKEGDASLKATGQGSAVFVIFSRNNSTEFGSFDVYLNGQKAKTINTDQHDGWGEAYAEQIIKFQTSREMEIEIVPTEKSKGKTVKILGIAVCDNPGT